MQTHSCHRMSIKSASISEGKTTDARFFSLCEREEHGRAESQVKEVEIKNRGLNVDDLYLDKSLG